MRELCLAFLGLGLVFGCGGADDKSPTTLPVRGRTAGTELLTAIPAGADLILEVDFNRLRNNPIIGALLAKTDSPALVRNSDLLMVADAVVLSVFGIGDGPRQLLVFSIRGHKDTRELLSGHRGGEIRRLRAGVFAVGDDGLLGRAEALTGSGGSVADDLSLMTLRARVMPPNVSFAALRFAAVLDFDARVSIAARIDVSEVPVSIALWADVVDDLAIVADFSTENHSTASKLERAIRALQSRLAMHRYIRYLGLSEPLRSAQVIRIASGVRVVFVLGPKRLQFLVDRIQQQLLDINS